MSNELGESLLGMLAATSPPREDALKVFDEAQAVMEQSLSLSTVRAPSSKPA